MSNERFRGIDRLYGRGSVRVLAHSHVCIVGIGGVGSWAAEALARSGVGHLTLIDADDICISNTNRQLHALEGQYGRPKVEVMAERLHAINPAIEIHTVCDFVTSKSLEKHLTRGYDAVIDACDALRVKVDMIAFCKRRKIPIVVCGSAGGRTDSTKITLRDLTRTEHDALLGLVRGKLRDDYGWTRSPKRYFGVAAVFSCENVKYPQTDGSVCEQRPSVDANTSLKLDCGNGLGAATHVTASFAFAAVGHVLQRLLRRPAAE